MIVLTKHAREAMELRGLALAWVEETILRPDWTAADPNHPDRTRSYKAIPALGGRILRVVHRSDGADIVVITTHPDRGAKR